jgi:(4S)-4-hydroxy-5-phosphonooxypentane-2,3-dione isomerase
MQVLLVEFRIHASFVPAFEAAIAENARASRAEPGCRQFDVCRDPTDASRCVLYERWQHAGEAMR